MAKSFAAEVNKNDLSKYFIRSTDNNNNNALDTPNIEKTA